MGQEALDRQTLVTIGCFVVMSLWVASIFDGMLTGHFTAAQIVTPIMMLCAGYLFAKDFFDRRNGNGKS